MKSDCTAVSSSGELSTPVVKVGDFGLARYESRSRSGPHTPVSEQVGVISEFRFGEYQLFSPLSIKIEKLF